MALESSGAKVRLREILLRDKPDEMLAASPKGTVPVLVTNDGVIDESLEVMAWALDQNDPEGWRISANDVLIKDNDSNFKQHLDRYKYATRYPGADPIAHRDAAMVFINALEDRLTSAPFLAGQIRSQADIAIFPFIRQFRIADEAWFDNAPIARVQAWLDTLMGSSLFQSVMQKYPLWKETEEETVFPAS